MDPLSGASPSSPPKSEQLTPAQLTAKQLPAQSRKDELAGLQFKQTKSQRNKPRSFWPKILLGAMIFGLGYGAYVVYTDPPAFLSRMSGKPGATEIAQMLVKPLSASLSVGGFSVPARYVEIAQVDVQAVEPFDKRDDVVLYRATGSAVARLRAPGVEIVRNVSSQIGSNARRLDFDAARDAGYSMIRAQEAIGNAPAGTSYPLEFEVIVRVVDGNAVLVDGNVSSEN